MISIRRNVQNKRIIERRIYRSKEARARRRIQAKTTTTMFVRQWKGGMVPVGRSSRSHFQEKIDLSLKQWSSASRTNAAFLAQREHDAATGALGFTFDTSWRALHATAFTHMLVLLDPPRTTAPFSRRFVWTRLYRAPGISTPSR